MGGPGSRHGTLGPIPPVPKRKSRPHANNRSEETGHGCLYLVATPIGNLGDITERAVETLSLCQLLACEDTRKTRRLLSHLGISARTTALHDFNEESRTSSIADLIAEGQSVGIVSDAGTPAISDPGFRVVRECRRRNLPVVPIPGPSAVTTALCASGLPSDGFLFAGFLPPKKSARRRFFERYRDFEFTIVLFESTHRITKFLEDLIEVLGAERVICVAREITKIHESFHTGPVEAVQEEVLAKSLKGEFVVLIAKSGFVL